MSGPTDGGAGGGQPPQRSDRRFTAPSGFDAGSTERIETRPEPETQEFPSGGGASQAPTVVLPAGIGAQPPTAPISHSPALSQPPPAQQSPPSGPTPGRRRLWIFAGVVAVVVMVIAAGVLGYVIGVHKSSPQAPSRSSGSSATQAPSASATAPGQVVLPFGDLKRPTGVAVDNKGAVYVTDYDNNQVLVLAPDSTAPNLVQPFVGLGGPEGVAVDSMGTVYVTDRNHRRVMRLGAGSSIAAPLPSRFDEPFAVAANAPGTVVVLDKDHVLAITNDSTVAVGVNGLRVPMGVAVDGAGFIYVTDFDKNRVLKLTAPAVTPAVALPFSGLAGPSGIAVDNAGSVYVTDKGNKRVVKLAAGSNVQTDLPFKGPIAPGGVAVDGAGNVYVIDNNRVVKLPQS